MYPPEMIIYKWNLNVRLGNKVSSIIRRSIIILRKITKLYPEVFRNTVFLKLMCRCFRDTKGPLMVGAECPKIFDTWCREIHICDSWKDFCFWSICRLLHLIFIYTSEKSRKLLEHIALAPTPFKRYQIYLSAVLNKFSLKSPKIRLVSVRKHFWRWLRTQINNIHFVKSNKAMFDPLIYKYTN